MYQYCGLVLSQTIHFTTQPEVGCESVGIDSDPGVQLALKVGIEIKFDLWFGTVGAMKHKRHRSVGTASSGRALNLLWLYPTLT